MLSSSKVSILMLSTTAGTELEVLVSNRDTLRKQWEEIMNVCIKDRSGSLPGKTIIFAMTKEHASRIREVFEEMFPQYPGLLQVVYHRRRARA